MEPKEMTLEESMKQIMKTLPPVIREYLSQGKYTPVARNLMTKYDLRIDQGGILEREIMLLLLGVESPADFTKSLSDDAGLTREIINNIIQEVNDQIFVPLRKAEEKGTPVLSAPLPTTHFKLENKIPIPRPVPEAPKIISTLPPAPMKGLPPKVFLPRPSTLGEVVRSVLAAPKPIDNTKLLEDHEEPHIELKKVEVPPNLPGAMPPREEIKPVVPMPHVHPEPVIPKPEVPAPPVVSTPVEPKPIVSTPITSYSSDPYREPIDEPPIK